MPLSVVPASLVGHFSAHLVGGGAAAGAAAAVQQVNLVQHEQLSAAAGGVSSGGIVGVSSSKQHRGYLWRGRNDRVERFSMTMLEDDATTGSTTKQL